MKKIRQTEGFTLLEAVVAMAILGIVAATLGSGLVVSFRLNARSEQLLQARLQVAATAEILMARGIRAEDAVSGATFEVANYSTDWSAMKDTADDGFCKVTIKSTTYPDVSVTATIHINPEPAALPGGYS